MTCIELARACNHIHVIKLLERYIAGEDTHALSSDEISHLRKLADGDDWRPIHELIKKNIAYAYVEIIDLGNGTSNSDLKLNNNN